MSTVNVGDALKAAPGNQRVIMATLEACREPRSPSELDELMGGVLAHNRSVFTAVELRALLERHGAIAYEPSEEELEARAARARAEEAGEEEPVEVDEDGKLVVATPAEGTWSLTKAGRAYLDAEPERAYARDLFAREERYLPVYVRLMEFVGEKPRTKPEVDAVIDPDPLLAEPRMFAGHFLGELEKAGALAWEDAWELTETGYELLRELYAQAGK